MSEISVAVVIAAYNAQATLPAAIRSVLAQSRLPDEIIIVDDGSNDGTAKAAQALLNGCPMPHRLLRQSNLGPAAARNAGWLASGCTWIKFLDADDILAPHALATEAIAAAEAEPLVAVLYAPWQRQMLTGQEWSATAPIQLAAIAEDTVEALLGEGGFIQVGSALYSCAWLRKVGGFDERYRMIEDVDMHLRLAFAGARFQPINDSRPHSYYRISSNSLSHTATAEFSIAIARNAELAERQWRARDQLNAVRAQQLVQLYWQAAYGVAESPELFAPIASRIRALQPARPQVHSRFLQMLLDLGGIGLTGSALRWYRRVRR